MLVAPVNPVLDLIAVLKGAFQLYGKDTPTCACRTSWYFMLFFLECSTHSSYKLVLYVMHQGTKQIKLWLSQGTEAICERSLFFQQRLLERYQYICI